MPPGRDERSGSESSVQAERGARKPRFLTFFAVILLLLGGRLFFTSATDIHGVFTGRALVLSLDGSMDAEREILLRTQTVLANAISVQHPIPLLLHGVMRLLLALLYLFAVAALFSGDRRGGKAGRASGIAGLFACALHVLFVLTIIRGAVPKILPILSQALAEDAARVGRDTMAHHLVVDHARIYMVWVPLFMAFLGALFSLTLLAYFASRRLRVFYNEAG